MKKDFHYSVIKILAIKAGFNENDAQIIAHASQYVDDATTHQPVILMDPPAFIVNHKRYYKERSMFDPICTAHKSIELTAGIFRCVQEKVYVPFHFIPETDLNGVGFKKKKNYITKENGQLSNELMANAVNELKKSSDENRISKLIKFGITIHSYADTWSHQGFSGIHSKFNNIRCLKFKDGNKWKSKNYNILPSIGHAEVIDYPDVTNIEWKYKYKKKKNIIKAKILRKNYEIFMDASKHIFDYLCSANNRFSSDELWDDFKDDLFYCLKISTNDKEDLKKPIFNKKFPEIKLMYDEDKWKKEALNNNDYKWFYFHIEAYNRREYFSSIY